MSVNEFPYCHTTVSDKRVKLVIEEDPTIVRYFSRLKIGGFTKETTGMALVLHPDEEVLVFLCRNLKQSASLDWKMLFNFVKQFFVLRPGCSISKKLKKWICDGQESLLKSPQAKTQLSWLILNYSSEEMKMKWKTLAIWLKGSLLPILFTISNHTVTQISYSKWGGSGVCSYHLAHVWEDYSQSHL